MNDLLDIIYNQRKKIGLKKDVTFDEIKELNNLIENWYKNENKNINNIPNSINNDIEKLIKLSIKMTKLLEECRKNKLPISLAKDIDYLLDELKNMQ